jgi:hypothetical protein
MDKTLLKQSFLSAFASSLIGLVIFYLIASWFDNDNVLDTIEFLLLTLVIMPISIGFLLVIFSFRFLSDYYKENTSIKGYKVLLLLFIFTGLTTILLDESYFLINDDVSQAFERVYTVLGEKNKVKESVDDDFSIEEISDYAPWLLNVYGLVPCLLISSIISTAILKRSVKKTTNNYV